MAPTFSIALASYNSERYLGSQLQSILEQTIQPSEVVVSDDASTDSTADMVAAFARRAPFPVLLKRNVERVGWQRNFARAALHCTGDLIAFSDHDDIWLAEKIERILHYSREYEWDVLVHANAFLLPSGVMPQRAKHPHLSTFPRSAPFYGGFDGHRMVFARKLLPWLELQDKFDDWLFDAPIAHDRLIMLGAVADGKTTLYVDDVLLLFRRHASQVTVGTRRSSTAADYAHRSEVIARWIASLEELSRTDVVSMTDAAKTIATLQRIRDAHRLRAALHGSGAIARRVQALATLLLSGAYASQSLGGLGPRALLKDAASTIVPAFSK
jgi:glycosyltransferase involved in cell wall biosynthesis